MPSNTDLAAQISLWADRLRDISALGLQHDQNIYDHDRYTAIQQISLEMFALAGGDLPEALEPIRDVFFGRPTPHLVGDASIFDDQGRILLIRRADNRLWAMPGGALEVGETPLHGVLREALEETGWRCRAAGLIGVFDLRKWGERRRFHLVAFQFLCFPIALESPQPSHAHEVLEKAWFHEHELPTDRDPGHQERVLQAFRFYRQAAIHNGMVGELPAAYYDPEI